MKKVYPITLQAQPPLTQACFDLLKAAGAEHFALFGGAIRDADHAARQNKSAAIKDYDLRVWLPEDQHQAFVEKIAQISGAKVAETPSAGTGRIRYCLNYQGAELDISLRPVPAFLAGQNLFPEAVALDRAADSDIGICSVAIDPLGRAWATPEYAQDQENSTLTVYPGPDAARLTAYAARMQTKFPTHRIVELALGGSAQAQRPSALKL